MLSYSAIAIFKLNICLLIFSFNIVPINPPTPPSNIQIPPPSFGTISLTLPQPDEIDTGEL